jgi:flagellar export protein FliJ
MARTFRLATLERLRTTALESRGQELHTATLELAGARAHHAGVERALAGATHEQVVTPSGVTWAGHYRERLRSELVRALEDVVRREAAVAAARSAWLAARAELKAVTVLHDRHRENLRTELAQREQLELDDLAGSRQRAAIAFSGDGRWEG